MNVVYVDFKAKVPLTPVQAFMMECQNHLCMEDYADFVDALFDPATYKQVDSFIQDLVDNFHWLDK